MKEPNVTKPVRILCLEDNHADQILLEHTLEEDGLVCDFVHATTEPEFESALKGAPFDLIISDFGLPAYNGMAALNAARNSQANTPFVFVSGTIGEERAVESLKNGATDYVLKDRRDRLASAVRRALRESQERADRRQAELQVRIQATALEAAANGILITDRNGTILFANKALCVAAGRELEEVVGQTPSFLKSGKHPPEFYQELWRTILSGRVWRGEVTNRSKDGTLHDEEMTITPVFDAAGRISHFIGVAQDVTRRKQLEEQLRQAQKLEAIGRLAGGVAHDFNNMLAVVLGNVEFALLNPAQFSKEIHESLKDISTAAHRAAELTRQLLAFGRKQTLQLRTLDLNEAIGHSAKMLKRIIGEDIQLACNPDTRAATVEADAGMLEQVIFNLAINARDAMPKGGQLTIAAGRVTLDERYAQAHPEAQAGEHVVLSVSDTGTGIAPEDLPRIFEPFFTTKEVGKGTGLGLAMVHGIVKQHHGWIEVQSQPGTGTSFRIYLPAVRASAVELGETPAKRGIRGGSERILLVEDDLPLRSLMKRTLENAGYQVAQAATGQEALGNWEARTGEIDLLVTDVVMPGGVNGRELADRFRRAASPFKVIFVSGYGVDAMNGYPLVAADTYFLQKPFAFHLFLDTVRRCLDRKPAPSATN